MDEKSATTIPHLPESPSPAPRLPASASADGTHLPGALTPADPDPTLVERVEADLEIVPAEERTRVAQQVVATVSAEFYRGPLPHPRHLQAYEAACPGLANRIMAMAEKAQNRQETRLDRAMNYEYADRRLGMICGFSALLALLISGVVIIAIGHPATGSALLGAAIIGTVIGTFVHGRRGGEPEVDSTVEGEKEKPSLWRRFLSALTGGETPT